MGAYVIAGGFSFEDARHKYSMAAPAPPQTIDAPAANTQLFRTLSPIGRSASITRKMKIINTIHRHKMRRSATDDPVMVKGNV